MPSTSRRLGSHALGVAREERAEPDVRKPEVKHDDTFEPNATAGMRVGTKFEGIDVGLHRFYWHFPRLAAFDQQIRAVYTLRTEQNG